MVILVVNRKGVSDSIVLQVDGEFTQVAIEKGFRVVAGSPVQYANRSRDGEAWHISNQEAAQIGSRANVGAVVVVSIIDGSGIELPTGDSVAGFLERGGSKRNEVTLRARMISTSDASVLWIARYPTAMERLKDKRTVGAIFLEELIMVVASGLPDL